MDLYIETSIYLWACLNFHFVFWSARLEGWGSARSGAASRVPVTRWSICMHKVCTKSAQGCIQAIHAAKCANYASMHMPATCTGLHNLQSVRVHKFMCLHNMPKLQSVQKCKVCKFCAVCKMHVCYVRKCRNPSAGLMCIWYKLLSVQTKCARYA